jgi:hypothetical protein
VIANGRTYRKHVKCLRLPCLLLAWGAMFAGCSSDNPESPGSQTGSAGAPIGGTPATGGAGAVAPPAAAGSLGTPMTTSSGGRAAPPVGVGGSSGSIASAGRAAQAGTGGVGAAGGGGMSAGATALAGMGAAGAGAGGSGGASPPAATCEKGKVKAAEVVIIGESFIAQSGAIPRLLTEHARDAGTIGMTESYPSFAVSGTQLTTDEIPMQYTRAKAAGPVKAVLMDGGGNDLLFGGFCTGGPETCAEVLMVVQTLFKQMGTDGVKDVVYFFYPDPMGIGADIKAPMDVLRPLMKKLCDEATDVRCVWVDQRASWDGHYSTYTSDGIHPTEEGAAASAKQIWEAMVANCVAQ